MNIQHFVIKYFTDITHKLVSDFETLVVIWNLITAKKHCVTGFGRKKGIITYPINSVEGILGRQTDISKPEFENDFTVNH